MAESAERALDAFLVASARLGDRTAFETQARRWHCKLPPMHGAC